jgi:membrane associated rhomboid family serine protease
MSVNAPWESEECFPEKPPGSDFGYLDGSELVAASQSKLIERCAGLKRPEIELVWHPGAPRLVPVWTVGFLAEALRAHEKAVLKQNARVAGFNVLVLCVCWTLLHKQAGSLALITFFGIFFGAIPLYQSWSGLRDFDKFRLDTTSAATPIDRYAAWVETRSDTMTRWLLGVITVIGVCQILVQYWLRPWPYSVNMPPYDVPSVVLAGLLKENARHGQWWRLFTAPLLHANLVHFMFNAAALFGLGRLMEALAGKHRLATVFALSAVGGSLLSLWTAPRSISVGASGGLLGLIGYLMALGCLRKAILPPGFIKMFALNVALVAVMGIAARSMIDNAAHLGGFLTGLSIGALTIPWRGGLPLGDSRRSEIAGTISFGCILGFAVVAAGKILGKF